MDLNMRRGTENVDKSGGDVIRTHAPALLVELLGCICILCQAGIHYKLSLHHTGPDGLQGGGKTLAINYNIFLHLRFYFIFYI